MPGHVKGVLFADYVRMLRAHRGRTWLEFLQPEDLPFLQRTIDLQGPSSKVGRGDILVIRTGQHTRVRRDGWGDYAGGSAPGLSFSTAPWLHRSEIAGIATDTWGFEVRPNEFDGAFQPLHQIAIPNLGLFLGEMWDPDGLAEACAADGRYDFLLTAAPLPITGAVGSPVNPIALR